MYSKLEERVHLCVVDGEWHRCREDSAQVLFRDCLFVCGHGRSISSMASVFCFQIK